MLRAENIQRAPTCTTKSGLYGRGPHGYAVERVKPFSHFKEILHKEVLKIHTGT